jgi:predicted GIY-YIG superfamily endonuclease
MDKRKFNGGARIGAGRKKRIGMAYDIEKHCFNFISEILKDDAIKLKATKQLAEIDLIKKQDYLYIIENNGAYKIGYSSNWQKRYKNYKTHLGSVNLIYLTKQENCFDLENKLHSLFSDKRTFGEWFYLNGDDLLKAISYCSYRIK